MITEDADDRANYPDELDHDERAWRDSDDLWHGVVVDAKTGIAFTAHNVIGQPIPRLMLAELFDAGFEP